MFSRTVSGLWRAFLWIFGSSLTNLNSSCQSRFRNRRVHCCGFSLELLKLGWVDWYTIGTLWVHCWYAIGTLLVHYGYTIGPTRVWWHTELKIAVFVSFFSLTNNMRERHNLALVEKGARSLASALRGLYMALGHYSLALREGYCLYQSQKIVL